MLNFEWLKKLSEKDESNYKTIDVLENDSPTSKGCKDNLSNERNYFVCYILV